MDALRELDGLGGMRIPDTLQRSLFTQLFSEFDAFTGSLLKVIYKSKEDLLKGISRQITFADLLSYENLNDVKIDMLEKEIENFRRDGYVDQFIALENKFGLKLRGFSEWGEFIELSQRRNLIVHNGGIVNDQYLIICDKEKFQFIQRPNTGDILKPDGKYFTRATIIVSKVAFMLCHTLWSKIFPNQRLDAQEAANGSLYALLLDKRWSTAYEIGLFCLSEPMRSPIEDIDLRLRTINVAIAAKFSKNARRCEEIIKTLDWSASIRDFKLAISVLTERFDEASVLMKQIGKNGELVTQFGYHEWPLFYEFRKTEQFLNSYKEVYEVSFIAEEVRHSAEVAKANEEEFNKSVTDIVDVVPESIPKKRSRKTTSLQ
ncbi:hypothetical protein Q9L58_010675 [Maublancomyces gigas]|uniref:Uncharacterized protein n=1 Tax=Discina gigas TaxID=1032678 RepID=A0ABR3G3H2_9PEZI